MVEPSTPELSKQANKQMGQNGSGADDSALEGGEHQPVPVVIVKRVNALKNIQLKMVDVETKFYEELHQLECKFANLYEPLLNQREKIISGEVEPSEEESRWALDDDAAVATPAAEKVNELIEDLKTKADIGAKEDEVKGIPDFWLQVFKCTDLISDMIQEHDEPVLHYLRDIRVKMHSHTPLGYTLEFYFNDNEYFSNKVLTKTYELTCEKDDKDPFCYDGPVMYKALGCKIEWVKGKDVTVRLVKKKQKHKNSGTIRVITKEEKQDSFFNFFDAPTQDGLRPSFRAILAAKSDPNAKPKEMDEEDEADESLCEADFEIGHFFKEFIVPKAVLYFTGELTDEAEEYEEYDEDDIEDGDDDDECPSGNAAATAAGHGNEDDNDEEEMDDDEAVDDVQHAKTKKTMNINKAKSKSKNSKD